MARSRTGDVKLDIEVKDDREVVMPRVALDADRVRICPIVTVALIYLVVRAGRDVLALFCICRENPNTRLHSRLVCSGRRCQREVDRYRLVKT